MWVGRTLGDRLGRCLDASATATSVLLADMPDHLDLGWNDIQLFRGHLSDLGQGGYHHNSHPAASSVADRST